MKHIKEIQKLDTNFQRDWSGSIANPNDIMLDMANKINEIIEALNKLNKEK